MELIEALLDHRNAFVGTAGAGKTYAAKSAVEILLRRQWRVCVIDPLGVWYGLRSSSDGAGPGFDITIFGGQRGDLPITEAAAPVIAEAIATGHFSSIVDLSSLPSQASRRRFMKAFAEALYAKNSEPLHLILDEADLFCPQRPIEDVAQILGARIDEIVRRGRVRGFVPWLISQRPAVIHKDVLSQVDTLVAFKLTSSQDRDALGAWIEGQADRAEQKRIYAKLPTLKQGDCIVWSPADGILQDYRFPRSVTFDSSRTPKRGERVAAPVGWSKPDLEGLRARLAAVEKEVAESDPKALRARVRELERQAIRSDPDPAAVEAARQAGWDAGYAAAATKLRAALLLTKERVVQVIDEAIATDDAAPIPGDGMAPSPAPKSPPPSRLSGEVTAAQQRVLDAIAWWRKVGQDPADRERACVVAGYSPKASTFGVYVADLVKRGFVEVSPGKVRLTDAGLKIANTPTAATREDLYQMARGLLGPQEQRVFEVVYRAFPKEVRRDVVAEKVGLSPSASTAGVYMARVAAFGLIEPGGRGAVCAAEWLFP